MQAPLFRYDYGGNVPTGVFLVWLGWANLQLPPKSADNQCRRMVLKASRPFNAFLDVISALRKNPQVRCISLTKMGYMVVYVGDDCYVSVRVEDARDAEKPKTFNVCATRLRGDEETFAQLQIC